MRNVIATILQIAAIAGLIAAGFLWCIPAGVAAAAGGVFVVGLEIATDA